MDNINVTPIGWVKGGRQEATKDHWGDNLCSIALDNKQFSAEALFGLNEVSHIEVIFYFHLHADEKIEKAARHPRGKKDWPKVGIFAQHGRMRPNRLGVSICKVVSLEGTQIVVAGLDAVDGTPILDIKPVWSGYLPCEDVREPEWAKEIMKQYW